MRKNSMPKVLSGLAALWLVLIAPSLGAGVPEPGLMMYGIVKNDLGGASVRMTSGALVWTIASPDGSNVTLRTALTNINDQFSYVLTIPFETAVKGCALSPQTLELTEAPAVYKRGSVKVDGFNAAIVPPATTNFFFCQAERGRDERVDLRVVEAYPDADGDGLPDYWEKQYFGDSSARPDEDSDGDGLTNRKEYLAGTHPRDNTSLLEFVETKKAASGEVTIRWASVRDRSYTIMRSANLMSGYEPLRTAIHATPPVNTYIDTEPAAADTYFYRIVVE